MVIFFFYQDMHNYNKAHAAGEADSTSRALAILFFVITVLAILVWGWSGAGKRGPAAALFQQLV